VHRFWGHVPGLVGSQRLDTLFASLAQNQLELTRLHQEGLVFFVVILQAQLRSGLDEQDLAREALGVRKAQLVAPRFFDAFDL